MPRCPWAITEPNITYHDEEWGVPVHDDRLFFEFLILEGAQAGLSWTTILKKRENYRKAFDGFQAKKISRYGRRARAHSRIRRNESRSAATRIQIRRVNDLLRLDASDRHGQRSSRYLSATRAARRRRSPQVKSSPEKRNRRQQRERSKSLTTDHWRFSFVFDSSLPSLPSVKD